MSRYSGYYDPYESYYGDRYGRQSYGRQTYIDYDKYTSSRSWSRFGNASFDEDVDDNLFIKGSDNYVTPTAKDIKNKLGYYNSQQEWVDYTKNLSRFFYHKMIENPNYFDKKYDNYSTLSEKDKETFDRFKPFYEDLWIKDIPGFTPLEKALNVIEAMIAEQKRSADQNDTPGQLKDMEKKIHQMKFDKDLYTDYELLDLIDENPFSKKMNSKMLRKISQLKSIGGAFKVEKEVEMKIVPHSRNKARRKMTIFEQLPKIDMFQKTLPTFAYKLATKNLYTTVCTEKTEHIQKIIICVDYSGSMNDHEKQQYVCALMLDRMRYVIKGEAEIFFSYYVHNPAALNFTHLKTKADCVAFWKSFSTQPNGGGTDLDRIVTHIGKEITEHKRLCNLNIDLSKERVEILAVHDGQDSIGCEEFKYKTNALCLMQDNDELKKLCLKNKGKYIFIDFEGKIHEHG